MSSASTSGRSTAEGTTANCSSPSTVAAGSPRSRASTASTTVGGTWPVPPAAKKRLPFVTAYTWAGSTRPALRVRTATREAGQGQPVHAGRAGRAGHPAQRLP
ncbi:hypothetical protein [Streptomyces sviceus]|uniref:hypothetical protein n=1 Tax=Streptomyces sviceus TaxID=285530 RepID=UPI0033242B92